MRSAVAAAATWVERTVAIAVLLAIPVIAPMSNLHFAGAGVPGNLVLLGAGLLLAWRGTPLEGLSELERDRMGYELGRQWIRTHPLDAAKLSLRKWRAYLGGDDHGAYWGVLRGAGGNEADAVASASLGRMALYRVANVVSLAYWVLLAALCARTILGWRVDDVRDGQVFRPLVYPLLCGAAVFGIFESGDRQHMFAVGPLIVLAVAGVVHRHGPRQAEGGTAAQA